jgi:hypothetical protein
MSSQATSPVLKPPPETDPHWREKVELAKQARDMGRELRAGKPISPRHTLLGVR